MTIEETSTGSATPILNPFLGLSFSRFSIAISDSFPVRPWRNSEIHRRGVLYFDPMKIRDDVPFSRSSERTRRRPFLKFRRILINSETIPSLSHNQDDDVATSVSRSRSFSGESRRVKASRFSSDESRRVTFKIFSGEFPPCQCFKFFFRQFSRCQGFKKADFRSL